MLCAKWKLVTNGGCEIIVVADKNTSSVAAAVDISFIPIWGLHKMRIIYKLLLLLRWLLLSLRLRRLLSIENSLGLRNLRITATLLFNSREICMLLWLLNVGNVRKVARYLNLFEGQKASLVVFSCRQCC